MAAGGYVIGLDLGTTGIKAVALDRDGRLLADSRADLLQAHAGWQPIGEVERATETVLRDLLGRASGRPLALGLSGAMHTLQPTDAHGEPVGDALTWACPQVPRESPDVYDRAERSGQLDRDALYQRTGCPPGSLYHPRRIAWLRQRFSEQASNPVARWSGIKEHIVHRLTGVTVSDHSIASATGLLDIHHRRWDPTALRIAGIGAGEQMPDLTGTTTIAGRVTAGGAEWSGLPADLPVIAGASDGALANIGAGAGPGEPVITLGTSAAVRYLADRPTFDPKRRTWCYIVDDTRYLVGTAMNNAGLALQAVIDTVYGDLAPDDRFARAMTEAERIPVDCDGLMALPFVTGERELIWPVSVAWTWLGLDPQRHTPAHRVRATMLAVSLMVRQMWAAVSPPAGGDAPVRLTGGVTRNPLWMRMLADATGRTLMPTEAGDASVRGAAMFGWRGLGEPAPDIRPTTEGLIEPDAAHAAIYRDHAERFTAACAARGWLRDAPQGHRSW